MFSGYIVPNYSLLELLVNSCKKWLQQLQTDLTSGDYVPKSNKHM